MYTLFHLHKIYDDLNEMRIPVHLAVVSLSWFRTTADYIQQWIQYIYMYYLSHALNEYSERADNSSQIVFLI